MTKKIIVTLSILVVTIVTSAVCFALNNGFVNKKDKPSDYHIGMTYDEAVQSDKPMLALFYADWCGYCMRFMPKFQTINNLYKNKYNIVMLNVDDPNNKKLVDEVVLAGFPTLYVIDNKFDNRVMLNNAIYMDLGKLRVELDRFLRIREMLEKTETCSAK